MDVRHWILQNEGFEVCCPLYQYWPGHSPLCILYHNLVRQREGSNDILCGLAYVDSPFVRMLSFSLLSYPVLYLSEFTHYCLIYLLLRLHMITLFVLLFYIVIYCYLSVSTYPLFILWLYYSWCLITEPTTLEETETFREDQPDDGHEWCADNIVWVILTPQPRVFTTPWIDFRISFCWA